MFRDIFNVLMFNGKGFLDNKELKPAPTNSIYYGEGEFHEQNQDYCNILLYNGVEYGVLGTENYSRNDKYVSVRVANYTAGVMRVRLKVNDDTNWRSNVISVVPVIILVLNFSNHRWKKNKSLHKLMRNGKIGYEKKQKKKRVVSEEAFMSDEDYCELISKVSNIEPMIIDVAFLSKEVRAQFTSDFKIVADFFAEKREGSYNPYNHNEVIKHPLDMLMFFKEYASDSEYEAIKESIIKRIKKGEKIRMCTFAQEFISKGREEGERLGREEGERLGREEGERLGREEGERLGREEGERLGREEGERLGEERLARLMRMLKEASREIDLIKAIEEKAYREQLYAEYGI